VTEPPLCSMTFVPQPEDNPTEAMMTTMPANHDHRERAEALLADIANHEHIGHQLTATAAIAEAMLAVADELEELRAMLRVRPPGPSEPPRTPPPPAPIPGDVGAGPLTWPPQ
jgi:hypothetical protein